MPPNVILYIHKFKHAYNLAWWIRRFTEYFETYNFDFAFITHVIVRILYFKNIDTSKNISASSKKAERLWHDACFEKSRKPQERF